MRIKLEKKINLGKYQLPSKDICVSSVFNEEPLEILNKGLIWWELSFSNINLTIGPDCIEMGSPDATS